MRLCNYTSCPTRINNAKPKGKLYKLTDGGGLFIEVSAAGLKTWRYQTASVVYAGRSRSARMHCDGGPWLLNSCPLSLRQVPVSTPALFSASIAKGLIRGAGRDVRAAGAHFVAEAGGQCAGHAFAAGTARAVVGQRDHEPGWLAERAMDPGTLPIDSQEGPLLLAVAESE
jgi:hypothetical protein